MTRSRPFCLCWRIRGFNTIWTALQEAAHRGGKQVTVVVYLHLRRTERETIQVALTNGKAALLSVVGPILSVVTLIMRVLGLIESYVGLIQNIISLIVSLVYSEKCLLQPHRGCVKCVRAHIFRKWVVLLCTLVNHNSINVVLTFFFTILWLKNISSHGKIGKIPWYLTRYLQQCVCVCMCVVFFCEIEPEIAQHWGRGRDGCAAQAWKPAYPVTGS